MRTAISETDRRREIQLAYNKEHGITPETVQKGISDISDFLAMESRTTPARRRRSGGDGTPIGSPEELMKLIVELEEEMIAAAEDLRFEEAARIRDELKELRRDLEAMRA
jgi:excinuclease ABC subunit B